MIHDLEAPMLFLTHNQTFPFFAVSTHVFLFVYHCIYIQLGVPLLNRKSIARPSQTMHHEGTGYMYIQWIAHLIHIAGRS